MKFRGQAITKKADTENGEDGVETRSIPARELWDRIIENSYNSAGMILNIGLANKMNNIHYYKPLISTNPAVKFGWKNTVAVA